MKSKRLFTYFIIKNIKEFIFKNTKIFEINFKMKKMN
jgi:hypothetical protein